MPNKPEAKAARCPVCGKSAASPFRPFCSQRCKQVDLGRWLSGSYAIPGTPAEPEEDKQD
ncbi:DNA gyrase inhibitor YacG [Teichococcus oryzae]|uniref:DNA gyrase inhibitor YacG n=1 Tax=Teichococcus oryzae TaxID=1608942 RepID=A0A5B2TB68_9PROT|nr:DNA gyrase inhibitor YacG [Pseudoroseomonas oryzae]KAA2211742.1 DNA gyrase inhibitor YacG [Pseudoroseomonas oryzae]